MMIDYIPGVPAAGHLGHNGFWHQGTLADCVKCEVARAMMCRRCGGPRTKVEVEERRHCRNCARRPR